MKNVVVLCPGDTVTGGPELIHQFIDALRNKKVNAKILYFPLSKKFEVPSQYSKYNIEISSLSECRSDNVELIVPEIATQYLDIIGCKNKTIWWLSVDNFFESFPKTIFGKVKNQIKKYILKKPTPLFITDMSGIKHLSQSFYGKHFLNEKGINDVMLLSDYLNQYHLDKDVNINEKKDIVVYNPKKGVFFTNRIIGLFPHIKFVPIQNMTSKEVSTLLDESKVYIDFGEHPGKDRIPREAAMAKCVVITGTKGSANNHYDVPIPDSYKFNEKTSDINSIGELFSDVFIDFENHMSNFDNYREIISNERKVFLQQVDLLIKKL